MQSLEPLGIAIVWFFSIVLAIFTIRKATYNLYRWFPNAWRVHQFLWQRKADFYWMNRADFSSIQLLRLYALWIMARFDKYFPLIDCERQAAKAQYFHDRIGHTEVLRFHFRYINPKAWPILFLHNLSVLLFSVFSRKGNEVLNNFQATTSSANTDCESKPVHKRC